MSNHLRLIGSVNIGISFFIIIRRGNCRVKDGIKNADAKERNRPEKF